MGLSRILYGEEKYDDILDTESKAADGFHVWKESVAQTEARANDIRISFRPWAELVPIPGQGGLDFSMFPFQEELYSDEVVYAKDAVVMKATQAGISEWLIRWAMFFADTRGDTALYVFPNKQILRDFSDGRVKPLIQSSEYLKAKIPRESIDNKLLKQIGIGWLYARGSRNKTDLISVPADLIAFDEYDSLVMANIPDAEKRLSAPTSRGLIRRIGVPSYSDYGIHARYELSDQRRWLVKCGHCGKELPLSFFIEDDHSAHWLDQEAKAMACGNCEKEISREQIATGRWAATFPDRDSIGFHVSRLMVPSANYAAIIEESKLTKDYEVQTFWNSTLGLPYDAAEGRLSKDAIAAAISAGGNYMIGPWDAGYAGQGIVTMGIDVASVRDLNVRISEHLDERRKRALFIGRVPNFDTLAVMMDVFRVRMAVIDGNPDGRLARGFCDRFPGRAFWISWGDGLRNELMKMDEEMRHVDFRRTELISATLDLIRTQNNLLPVNHPLEYVKHMRSPVLRKVEDDKGRVVVYYEKSGDDDYLQAEAYDVAATMTWWALYLKGEAQEEVYRRLEEMMPIPRAHLGDYSNTEWSPGYRSDEETWASEREEIEREGMDPGDEFGPLRGY